MHLGGITRKAVLHINLNLTSSKTLLYCYKDSLEVLTRNKGSKNIRGIILPKLINQECRELHVVGFSITKWTIESGNRNYRDFTK
nr:hypothetical protein CFP56_29145 [Quercus suber]